MNMWWLLPAATLVALILTGALRHYALARSLIDIPNARSSHVVPTPRGGGVSIVISFLLALVLTANLGAVAWSFAWALLGAGAGIAVLGFLDDHGHIGARWRLLGHFIAAAWVLFWVGGLPPLELLGFSIDLGWVVPQFPVSVFIVAALLLGMTVGPLVGWIASRTIRARRRKHLA